MNSVTAACALVAVACVGLAWEPAAAQTPPASRIRGKIEAVEGHTVSIATRENAKLSVKLADDASVSTVKPVDIASITSGTYVGIAAEPDGHDGYRALEVLVFPEAMRGAGEGHYDWDLAPRSSMTNATVKAVVDQRSGRDLQLTYKDQGLSIAVPPGVPVVTLAPATWADVKPGAPVFLSAAKQPDGTWTASRITVGTGGVAPPM